MLKFRQRTRGAPFALKSLAPGYFIKKNKGMPKPKKIMYSVPGFEIKELLHKGDHTLIVRAEETAGNRPVIVKFLNRQHPGNQEFMRFKHDYETFSNFSGVDGIARVL